jgi:hypothetical protein
MKHLLSYILLPHFYLFTRVQAYWLHSSCTNHPNAAFIDQQVIAAFQLAADTGLKFVVWDDVNGMDADEKRLFDLLLGGGQNNFDEASS